jgi:hypothetical protein
MSSTSVGILLNAPVFCQRAQHIAVGTWCAVLMLMLVLSICVIIFSLTSVTGRQAFRLRGITTLMISAAVSNYMRHPAAWPPGQADCRE